MKLKNVIIVLTTVLLAGCTTIKLVRGEQYKKIIAVQGKDMDELYILSSCWLVETFVSTEGVIEFQDREAGKVIGKCMLSTAQTNPVFFKTNKVTKSIKCIISIDVKDNAVRITFIPPDSLTETEAIDLKIKWRSIADEFETYLNRTAVGW
ncbi:MAG: DUF4468 domain-containing protein [Prevotellaceae bacterium]|jgi:hypothetical protein|nr:DUF4468 domain-containing protein [Prevotellaceae bacterium]